MSRTSVWRPEIAALPDSSWRVHILRETIGPSLVPRQPDFYPGPQPCVKAHLEKPCSPGVAEFEHDLIVERTKEGLEAARSRGKTGGRKPGMSATQIRQARVMIEAGPYTKKEIAETFKVSRATFYWNLAEREPA